VARISAEGFIVEGIGTITPYSQSNYTVLHLNHATNGGMIIMGDQGATRRTAFYSADSSTYLDFANTLYLRRMPGGGNPPGGTNALTIDTYGVMNFGNHTHGNTGRPFVFAGDSGGSALKLGYNVGAVATHYLNMAHGGDGGGMLIDAYGSASYPNGCSLTFRLRGTPRFKIDYPTSDIILPTNDASTGGGLRQQFEQDSAEGGFGSIRKTVRGTNLADNIVTTVFMINTTNESGNTDGGTYVCHMKAMVSHGGNNNASGGGPTTRYWEGVFSQALDYGPTGHFISGISEIFDGAETGINQSYRDIDNITVTAVASGYYRCDVKFQVDLSGSNIDTAEVVVVLDLIWEKYRTPPTIST